MTADLNRIKVEDIMVRNVIKAHPKMTILEAAKLMAAENVGALPVIDDQGKLIGMLSERDIVRRVVALEKDPTSTLVEEVMTPKPITVKPDYTLADALRIMAQLRVRHLPVVDDRGNLIGIISIRDIENALI